MPFYAWQTAIWRYVRSTENRARISAVSGVEFDSRGL